MEQEISGKKDSLKRLTEIFKKKFWQLSVPFDFEPQILKILVKWNAPQNFFPW